MNINIFTKYNGNIRIFNLTLISIVCVLLSAHSLAGVNSIEKISNLARSLNAKTPILLGNGNMLEKVTYDPANKIFSRYITQPRLDFSTVSVEDAKRSHKDKLKMLLPECDSMHTDLIHTQNVTFRYYFKDQFGILTSMIDINKLTCEALN